MSFQERVEVGLGWLAGQRLAMQRLLERLVRLSSCTGDASGVNAVVSLLEGELRRIGLRTARLPSPRFGDHLAFETTCTAAPPAFLLGHTDTVFPRGSFEGFELAGDTARGPGVFDMKGGLVVGVFALEALARAALLRHVPVRGLFVSDEEVGSPDSQGHLRERAAGAACALGLEPGREGDLIVTGRKGVTSLLAEATGVAAHAGNDAARGRSAIWSLARFVDRAQALSDPARGLAVNVGTFQGGTSKNTVPERARAEMDLRFTRREDGRGAPGRAADRGGRGGPARDAHRPDPDRVAPAHDPHEASAALARAYGACQEASGLGAGEAPLSGGGSDAGTTSAHRRALHRRPGPARLGLPHPRGAGGPGLARAQGGRPGALPRRARALRVGAPPSQGSPSPW